MVGDTVQSQILFSGAVVCTAIFECDRICKYIGGDNCAVTVINITTGAFDHACFGGTCLKFTDVILSLYDLQTEKLPDQDR